MKLPRPRSHQSPYADLAFFSGWSSDDLHRMERLAELVEYEPGEIVTSQGQLAREFLVIVCGRAAAMSNHQPIRTITEGETIGEEAMLAGPSASVAVVAQTYLKALLLGPQQFNGLLSEAPSMGRRLSQLLARRLHDQLSLSPA
jgi:CRP-like cAMP-binding protein